MGSSNSAARDAGPTGEQSVPRETAAAPGADVAALTALGNRQVAGLAGGSTSSAAARALVRAAAAGGNRAAGRVALMRQERPRIYGPPTEDQAAEAVLAGAARLLSISNFISARIDHTNAVEGMTVAGRERGVGRGCSGSVSDTRLLGPNVCPRGHCPRPCVPGRISA